MRLPARASGRGNERIEDGLLAVRQGSRFAGRKIAQPNRSKAGAHEPFDFEPQGLADASYFVRATFRDRDLKSPTALAERVRQHLARDHHAVFQFDATTSLACRCDRVALDRRDIGPLDLPTRVREGVRGAPIGREQEDTFGHEVESTDIYKSGHTVHEIEHGFSALWITARGDDSRGLVQHNPPVFGDADTHQFPIEGDLIASRVDEKTNAREFTVYANATLGHRAIRLASRREARTRQRTLHAHGSFVARGNRPAFSAASRRSGWWRSLRTRFLAARARFGPGRLRGRLCSRLWVRLCGRLCARLA